MAGGVLFFWAGTFCGIEFLRRQFPAVWPATQSEVIHRLDFAAARGQIGFMSDENSRRTDRLEANLAHLEHQVEELNGVIIEQGKLLERLKKEVQRQSTAMQTLELERVKSNIAKPPHYQ
jgi:SlyX protein